MPTNIDLKGLRVALTGGTSGLGLALVRLLAGHGVCVAFVARTAERTRTLDPLIKSQLYHRAVRGSRPT